MNDCLRNMQKYLLLLLLFHCAVVLFAEEWGYQESHNVPSDWEEEYPTCGHSSQSPININTNNTLPNAQLSMLKFEGYEQTLDGGEFVNNGHSVQLNFPSDKVFSLSSGGMGDSVYTGLQLHFHWSSPGSPKGSEHTINGHHYPVEMHIVHIKNPYTSTEQIKDMTDGLTVLGVFLRVGSETNAEYQKLFDVAQSCVYAKSNATLSNGATLISLLPKSASYYRYSGSLTTPPCYEAVTWTVFQEPVVISQQQLEILQSLKSSEQPENEADQQSDDTGRHGKNKRAVSDDDQEKGEEIDSGDGLGGNYRPTQPLNGRIVSSFLDKDVKANEEGVHWSYHEDKSNPSQWYHSYPLCGGGAQSPINIQPDATIPAVEGGSKEAPTLQPITYKGYDHETSGIFVNNGHSVQLDFGGTYPYTLSDGGLDGEYKAVQLHFHWGQVGSDGSLTSGSEHTIGGVRYPAELHIVHAKTAYLKDLTGFEKKSSDALAVLGILIDVRRSAGTQTDNNEGTNKPMQMLFDAISGLQYNDDSTQFQAGPPLSRLLPQSKTFYRYNGSLTTPPCYETVVWTVFKEPIIISLNQFLAFEQLFSVERTQVEESNSIGKLQNPSIISTFKTKTGEISSESDNTTTLEGIRNLIGNKPQILNATISKIASNPDKGGSSPVTQYLIKENYRPLQQVNDRSITVYVFEEDVTTSGTFSFYPTEVRKVSESGKTADLAMNVCHNSRPAETEPTDLPVITIVLFSVLGLIVFIAILAMTVKCCCKEREQQRYAAGKVTEETINL